MEVFRRHVNDAEHAGIDKLEAEQHLAGILGFALHGERHFVLAFGEIVGADVDLNIDLGRLRLRGERSWRVRIFERQILGVLRQDVELGRRARLGRDTVAVGHESSLLAQ